MSYSTKLAVIYGLLAGILAAILVYGYFLWSATGVLP